MELIYLDNLSMKAHELLLILDFGSQYTQLIGRRIRELGVYSEIVPYNISIEEIKSKNPRAIILSGGPNSVHDDTALVSNASIFDLGVPVLGICYGMQLMMQQLGGKVVPGSEREYGKAQLADVEGCSLFEGVNLPMTAWMSHGDRVEQLADGFSENARTDNAVTVVSDENRKFYGLQFHPEVVHTESGDKVLENFVKIADFTRDWTTASYIDEEIKRIKDVVGDKKVIAALSGGVDSSVAASLVAKAIGDQQTCILVDTGLLRLNEAAEVMKAYEAVPELNVIMVDASDRFLGKLQGVTDPEKKRKIIGEEFIAVFMDEAEKLGGADFLVQGTLYPDVNESVSVHGPSAVIKSHHNVGGLPEKMDIQLIEPLRELFKDEVRAVGRELGLPDNLIGRHPFPGPGLAVRILGDLTNERIELLQAADAIYIEELRKHKIYDDIWQAFSVLLPVSAVGVMGDFRTYESVLALRAVTSSDGMTADWYEFDPQILKAISTRIVNEVKGINRVVYDITSKPPGTIEWE